MPNMSRTKAATLGLLAPAALALGMSADTSYRFLGTTLNITDHTERMLLCGVAETAIVALTIYAWATRTKGPAYLAYAAVLVQAIPAFQVSGATGGPIRVILGPVLLAVMLHLLLGLELRMSGDQTDGILAAALRELRERVTASLGIGRRGADSAAIARSRAADKAVTLADRVAAAPEGSGKHSRRAAKLAAAIDAARHGLDATEADAAEAAIVSRVVRRKSVAGLATIGVRHDWAVSVSRPKNRETESTALSLGPESYQSERRENPEIAGRESESVPTRGAGESRENDDDVTMYAASLLSHEPPPWADLTLRQAVAKADALIPDTSASMLSRTLAEIGVNATPGSIRSTRSALRRTEARES